jgi:hypothetical protein
MALVGGKAEVTEVQVSYSDGNEYERVAVKCPLCTSNKLISIAIKRTVSPHRVFIGNFKTHVELVHIKTGPETSKKRSKAAESDRSNQTETSDQSNDSDSSLFEEIIEECPVEAPKN